MAAKKKNGNGPLGDIEQDWMLLTAEGAIVEKQTKKGKRKKK